MIAQPSSTAPQEILEGALTRAVERASMGFTFRWALLYPLDAVYDPDQQHLGPQAGAYPVRNALKP